MLTTTKLPTTISTGEAAKRLGVHANTVRNWVDKNFLSAIVSPTGRRRVVEADVERLRVEMFEGVQNGWDRTELVAPPIAAESQSYATLGEPR